MVTPADVHTVACVGTGVIGGGWVAHFLRSGYDVVAWDPDPAAEARLRRLVDEAWPALTRLGLSDGASVERLRFTTDLADAMSAADVVQESAPERLDLKQQLLADLDEATDPDVVILSSTSGIAMTELAALTTRPGRFVVGHPFNPPYLIPLVEVCPGAKTDPATTAWATEFYDLTGKQVLTMDRELPGFVANRLQEAVWREVLHMVSAGEATPEQLDLSMTAGPGLRWPLMGPCLTFHLAGGEGGMGHMLRHFEGSLAEPWTRLEAPPLTDALVEAMVDGVEREADGASISLLQQQRDDFLVDLLALLDEHRRRWADA